MASLSYDERSFLTMKVIYQNCCGVDVHKSFFVAQLSKPLLELNLPIKRSASPPLTIQFCNSKNG